MLLVALLLLLMILLLIFVTRSDRKPLTLPLREREVKLRASVKTVSFGRASSFSLRERLG